MRIFCISTFFMAMLFAVSGCSYMKEAAGSTDALPDVFPDYKGVTIPVNIAPMNFMVDGAEHVQARFLVDGKELTTVAGNDGVVDIPEDEWHGMTAKAAGKTLSVEVSVWDDKYPDGMRYKPFEIKVANEEIDPWIAYRLIEPGYESWRYMGIYQREIASFEEL